MNNNKENMVYAVQLASGQWEDYKSWIKFVTWDKRVAQSWVDRYNSLLNKLEKFYEKRCDDLREQSFQDQRSEELYMDYYEKKYFVEDTCEATIMEIEVR